MTRPPTPPAVDDIEEYWTERPPTQSARCTHWVKEIAAGWRPNRRIRDLGYGHAARFFGVWIWEYINVIGPALEAVRNQPRPR